MQWNPINVIKKFILIKCILITILICLIVFISRVEDEKPRPNVYIPPNLRKKTPLGEETVVIATEESEPIRDETVPDLDKNIPDRAADGSEIIEPVVVEAPIDVRTDPDGQSSEPDVVKDQPVTEEDTNDSGFIECGKNSSDKCNYLLFNCY